MAWCDPFPEGVHRRAHRAMTGRPSSALIAPGLTGLRVAGLRQIGRHAPRMAGRPSVAPANGVIDLSDPRGVDLGNKTVVITRPIAAATGGVMAEVIAGVIVATEDRLPGAGVIGRAWLIAQLRGVMLRRAVPVLNRSAPGLLQQSRLAWPNHRPCPKDLPG
jgi:hypothetical protein